MLGVVWTEGYGRTATGNEQNGMGLHADSS